MIARIILIGAACLIAGGCVQVAVPDRHAAQPILLTDRQLDRAVAGGAALTLDLSAIGEGSAASAVVQGSVRNAATTVFRVQVTPGGGPLPQVRLLGIVPANVLFGAGTATASGDAGAFCSAAVTVTGQVASVTQLSHMEMSPNLANCSCAALVFTTPSL